MTPPHICFLTLGGSDHVQRFERSVRSHRCYAALHNLTYSLEDPATLEPPPGGHKLPLTYRKLSLVHKWLHRKPRCDWVAHFDTDIFIVDVDRPLTTWFYEGAHVVLTDRSYSVNNGAFLLRNSEWTRSTFLPLWKRLSSSKFPFTDNGSMLEAINQLLNAAYRPFACPVNGQCAHSSRTWPGCFLDCHMHFLRLGFGAPRANATRGAGTRLALVPAQEAFNSHGCGAPAVAPTRCASWAAWPQLRASGRVESDYYTPVEVRCAAGLRPQFGFHAKNHSNVRVMLGACGGGSATAPPQCVEGTRCL